VLSRSSANSFRHLVALTALARLSHCRRSDSGAAMRQKIAITGVAALAGLLLTQSAEAAPRCRNTGSFDAWLAAFKQEAAAQGISRQAIAASLDGVTFDPAIIRRDSGQGV